MSIFCSSIAKYYYTYIVLPAKKAPSVSLYKQRVRDRSILGKQLAHYDQATSIYIYIYIWNCINN